MSIPVTGSRISAAAVEAIAADAADAYPEEACGILIGEPGRVHRVVRCANVAPAEQRLRRFELDPADVIRVRRELRGTPEAIIGFYHSHPDHPAEPSRTDLESFRLWPRTLWLIVPVHEGVPGAPRGWWLDAEDSAPRELEIRVGGGGGLL
jgi:proteasome lid subunit RPN8/RPN11